MDDKELVEVWRKEHKALLLATNNWCIANFQEVDGAYYDWHLQASWEGFLMAKRIQPSVVLPKNAEINHLAVDTAGEYDWNTIEAKEKYMNAFTDGALMICDDIARSLTAAGIKYTIGE